MSEVMSMTATRFVFAIEDLDPTDGRRFGGKATGLARMAKAGIPVPPAFAISTDAFRAFEESGRRLPDGLGDQVDEAIARLSKGAGRIFGGDGLADDPLLVSVRSGAQVSMPGMMDTVLNLGLDARSAEAIIARTGRRAFVIDSYMRFWKMYVEIVLGLDGEEFVEALEAQRHAAELDGADLGVLEAAIVAFVDEQGEEAPTDPRAQLDQAISAVFRSWNSPRAKAYREHQGIAHDLGTAVTVQAMVFGNAEGDSGSGVAFSRDPNTGEPVLYGEYLSGRQGEDIVSGSATPVDLADERMGHEPLRRALLDHSHTLEALYRDAVDIEFTLEAGRLFLLQVRPAKRTAAAAVRIAADLVDEGLISPQEAVQRVTIDQVKRLLRPVFSLEQLAAATVVGQAVGSSPGQASGIAVLDSDRAAERAQSGEPVILVRPTTSPLDIRGMLAAGGILTAKGGALSHAAVVSRALDRPCVVGCEALEIDGEARTFTIGGRAFAEGDYISIDGATGEIFDRRIELAAPESASSSLDQLLHHADALSGVTLWTQSAGEAAPYGLAVINLADIFLAHGLIDRMIEGFTLLAQNEDGDGDALAVVAQEAGEILLSQAGDRPFQVRLPQSGSARARFLIPGWPELDQRLFLPVGNPAYHRAMLRGLNAACEAQGRTLTVLLGGVTDVGEWTIFQKDIAEFPALSGGVVLQSVAGLVERGALEAAGARIWIDIDQTIHAAHGWVHKAYLSRATLDDYVDRGALRENPREELGNYLRDLLAKAPISASTGAQCSTDLSASVFRDLYRTGVRLFSVPAGDSEILRLLFGQAAAEAID